MLKSSRIPASDRARILAALKELKHDPFSGDTRQVTNLDYGYRRRVGNFRILYDVNDEHHYVIVYTISRRTSTTY